MASRKIILFAHNFNTTLAALGMMATDAKVQYICTLVRGEALLQFDLLSTDVEGTKPLTVETIILELDLYFYPVNSISKQKHAIRRWTRKPHRLKARLYADRFIDLNEYLA